MIFFVHTVWANNLGIFQMQDHNSPTSLCISDFAKVITDKIKDDEESGAVEADWKFAAMVISADCLFISTAGRALVVRTL